MQTSLRTFLPETARYVRIRMDAEQQDARLSVLEVGVHGGDSDVAAHGSR